jgi:hypothetical protein
VVAAGQAPLPSQLAVLVWVLPAQLWLRHPVVVGQKWHLPAPSQVPSRPQLVWAAAAQRDFGSAPPSTTGEQVPTFPVTLQDRQVPPLASLQVVLQQTPSVQMPLTHSAVAAQVAPLGLRPHELLMQLFGLTQSALVVQALLQAPVVVLHA